MSRIAWHETGTKRFGTGSKNMVLYKMALTGEYMEGVAWNGLRGVEDSPEGGDETALWADDIKYGSLRSTEQYKGTIKAYQSPPEFDECDGEVSIGEGLTAGQQTRRGFGFSYVTTIGNDVSSLNFGEEINLVYGASCSPSSRTNDTINDSPDAGELSWEFTTTPTPFSYVDENGVTQYGETAHLKLKSYNTDTATKKKQVADLKAILYGSDEYSNKKYAVGEYVTHENKTYRCKTAIDSPSETFTPSSWDEIGVAGPALPSPTEVAAICSFTVSG